MRLEFALLLTAALLLAQPSSGSGGLRPRSGALGTRPTAERRRVLNSDPQQLFVANVNLSLPLEIVDRRRANVVGASVIDLGPLSGAAFAVGEGGRRGGASFVLFLCHAPWPQSLNCRPHATWV